MTEDVTKTLTTDEKLDLLIERVSKLEALIEERLKDTRPIWQAIHATTEKLVEQSAQMETKLARIESKFDVLLDDVMDVRGAQRALDKRLLVVERQSA